jgi:hypothetical protein
MIARRAILLPGAGYTIAHPLLHFTRGVLEAHGWIVEAASWLPDDVAHRDPVEMVTEVATRLIDAQEPRRALLVGKSIGSFAIPLAADRGLSGIWLTPLLRQPPVADGLGRLPAPTILIGSRADESWDSDVARRSGHEIVELTDAHHGLELPGDPVGSVDALRTVIEAVDRFVGSLARDGE